MYTIVGLIVLFCLSCLYFINAAIRRNKKDKIKKYMAKKGIQYDVLLYAFESAHFVAFHYMNQQFYLLKYSEKLNDYQVKTFSFETIEQVDFFHQDERLKDFELPNLEHANQLTVKEKTAGNNLIFIRLKIKNIQIPYTLSLGQIPDSHYNRIEYLEFKLALFEWIKAFRQINE